MEIKNDHGLLTYKAKGRRKPQCLGDLMFFEGHGVYDPSLGRVEVTKEDAEKHNRVLDEARIKGLDKNCKVGQGGTFYLTRNKESGMEEVRTFLGTLVQANVRRVGQTVTFRRGDMVFRGRASRQHEMFNFRRVR